jgi:anti-sigma B factor antagonist
MSPGTRQHIRLTLVNGVAVVGFTANDSVFQPRDVQELDDELVRLVTEEGHTRILLDLAGIHYFSSSMLARLINLKMRVEKAQGRLSLCCLTPQMRDTFRVGKLDQFFNIGEDEASALAQFEGI